MKKVLLVGALVGGLIAPLAIAEARAARVPHRSSTVLPVVRLQAPGAVTTTMTAAPPTSPASAPPPAPPVAPTRPTTTAPAKSTPTPPAVPTSSPVISAVPANQFGATANGVPIDPGQEETVVVTECDVSWPSAQIDPATGMPVPIEGYGGPCDGAAAVAAQHPGAVVTQSSYTETTSVP